MGLREKRLAVAPPGYAASEYAAPRAEVARTTLDAPTQRPSLRDRLAKGRVEWSPDLSRILALPRRPAPDLTAISAELTARLKKPEGAQRLRPHQAWALWEAPQVNGCIGIISVGGGKSLVGMLMPMVMPNCRRAILFIPPALRGQFARDWEFYGQHWNLPNLADGRWFIPGRPVLHVVPYSELSNPKKGPEVFNRIKPDLVLADEAHNFRHVRNASKTRRLLNFFANSPDTRFCGWSGTLTASSIRDYAHLFALALGDKSPVPLHPPTVAEWANAIDPGEFLYNSGALLRLCNEGEEVRSGYRRRLVETAGVVATKESDIAASVVFYKQTSPTMPAQLEEYLRNLRKPPSMGGWVRPDGEEFTEAIQVYECARQLACGVYYRWRFPKGEPPELIQEWFAKRQSYNRELRARLSYARPYMDSPHLCKMAAARFYNGGCSGCQRGPEEPHQKGCPDIEKQPLWESDTWADWSKIEKAVYHETEAVWVSNYLLEDATKWLRAPGIVWTEHTAVGHRLSKLTGLPYYGGGKEAARLISNEDGRRGVIANIDAHGTGRNLQHAFYRNLFLTVCSSAALLEQAIGRTHRDGQKEDEVEVYFYLHTPELEDSLEKAKQRAKYLHETQSHQKLVYGAWAY